MNLSLNEVPKSLNSTHSSENSEAANERRLKIDPNYKWLLKGLNLNNNKRVIDVTALLDENDNSKMSQVENDNVDEHENSELEEGEVLKETQVYSDEQDDEDGEDDEDGKNNKREYSTSDSDNDSYDEQNKYRNKEEEEELSDKTNSKSSRTSSDVGIEKKNSDNENLDNTSKILNQVSFFSNSHLDAEEINDIDEVDADLNDASNKKKSDIDESNDDNEIDDDDDHKQDVNLISEIYQKFMFKNGEKILPADNSVENVVGLAQSDDTYDEKAADEDNNDEEDDVSQGIYGQWSKQFNSKNDKNKKEINKFSKSFEVNLEDLDVLINRVDSGIKLKRNVFQQDQKNREPKESQEEEEEKSLVKILNQPPAKSSKLTPSPSKKKLNDESKIVESLKNEWSSMFSKLENDYKLKLEEQQRLNDLKLEEIKKSLLENQEQLIIKQCNVAVASSTSENNTNNINNNTASTIISSSLNKSQDMLKSTFTIEKSKQQVSPTSSSASSSSSSSSSSGVATDPMTREKKSAVNESHASSTNQTNSIVENAKYISNLRLELKSKHARHVQDLKDYYEKELDDLRRKLNKAEQNISNDSTGNEKIISNFQQQNMDQANLNNELKNTNNSLLSKLVKYENSQHIQYLTHENFELKNKLAEYETEAKNSNEKICNLEHCCTQLEIQLTETIKLQDQYMRELHMSQKNAMKKLQECEELKMNSKIYEQKCDNYELKLDERDNIITRLKTKLIQKDTDLTRLDYEYQKLKSLNSKLIITNQSIISSQSNDNINLTQSQQLTSTVNIASKMNTPRGNKFSASNSNSGSLSNLSYLGNTNSNKFSSSTSNQISDLALKYVNHVNNEDEDHDYDDNDLYELDEQYNQLQMNDHTNVLHQMEQSQKPLSKNQSKNSQNQFNTSSNNSFANQLNQHVNYQSQSQSPQLATQQQSQTNSSINKLFTLNPDDRLKYIEKLEHEFDVLMKHKQQLDAQLTRLPFKATNTSMHTIRENIESELTLVEKKLDSVKLELRKLNILKTH